MRTSRFAAISSTTSEYGVLGLLGGSEWGTGGLGERRTTVSTSVTKGKQEQDGEEGVGAGFALKCHFTLEPVGGASCSCECGGLQCALG